MRRLLPDWWRPRCPARHPPTAKPTQVRVTLGTVLVESSTVLAAVLMAPMKLVLPPWVPRALLRMKPQAAGSGNVMADMVARVDLATRTRTRRATRKRTSRALPYRRRRGGRAHMSVPRSQPSRVEVAPLGLLKERA